MVITFIYEYKNEQGESFWSANGRGGIAGYPISGTHMIVRHRRMEPSTRLKAMQDEKWRTIHEYNEHLEEYVHPEYADIIEQEKADEKIHPFI
jgi:hypothetical protein